jgi:hypothetical protein
MRIKRYVRALSLLLVLGLTGFGSTGRAERSAANLDPRLAGFLEFVIKDPATLEAEKKDYASRGATFEPFIYAVYTGAVKIDVTPDSEEARRLGPNVRALAQLGQYLEEKRPKLSAELLDKMAEFYSVKSNQTFIRGMVLESVRRLTTAAPPAVNDGGTAATVETGRSAATAKTTATIRFSGLDNEAIGAARLVRQGAFLSITGIGNSGSDGVRIHLPSAATQVRVRAQVPNESTLAAGAYLEITSRPSGAEADSLGFLRITRISDADGYEVTGVVANATNHVLAVFNKGREVRRDVLGPSGNPFARVQASIKFESSLNDAVARGSSSEGAVLRWHWSSPGPITIMNRASGADTTVVADELRLLDANPRGGAPTTLSEFIVRGRDLGEIRIRAEDAIENRKKSNSTD